MIPGAARCQSCFMQQQHFDARSLVLVMLYRSRLGTAFAVSLGGEGRGDVGRSVKCEQSLHIILLIATSNNLWL